MSKERDDKFDPAQPTLVVQHGNTARKHRRLEKDVMVLGRAPGCDVGLDAPDVAAVHCVIVRAADGWRVRDCTGRGGTRLNGASVQDAALADEDVLQVGSFSFALHLPKQTARPAAPRLRRSRENFARLALRLRGRLRQAAATPAERVEERLDGRQDELDRQADELEALRSDLDARLGELRQTRQEIAAETVALLQRNERSEKELQGRQARADEAMRAALQGHQARCEAAEKAHTLALADQKRAHAESVGDAPRLLEIRGRELNHFAAHLRRRRLVLGDQEASLTAQKSEWLREQQEAAEQHALQGEQVAREEALLRLQRSEVVRLMGEMRQLRQTPRQPPVADAEALRRENEDLRRGLTERAAALAAATAESAELRGRLDAVEASGVVLDRCHFELEDGRRSLEDQIREVQQRYADLERAALEAESRIALGRGRIVNEREGLQRLRDGLGPTAAASPTQETVVDMPSPLHPMAETGLRPAAC